MGKNIAIKVENLSKAYQLGQIGTGTISRDLERFWTTKIRGKEDPFLKIGQTNDRTVKGESDIVWSLKDINFEIEQGDAVGIIGRNGAGKSTLLKLLSRVTAPTSGNIKIKGRIASLLEVGTGFHPELTGRENIYLNGAILGMRKKEITRKFDEIVDFSGVERYIDTPVKRYSSGMYVRLAFAVAAHLESEILIVDEVLAVGDAEFQKKCLGKMGEVSKGDGRTILFVSHNMSAINTLCNKGILLSNGKVKFAGNISETINSYRLTLNQNVSGNEYLNSDQNNGITRMLIKTSTGTDIHDFSKELAVSISAKFIKEYKNVALALQIFDERENSVLNPLILQNKLNWLSNNEGNLELTFPKIRLYQGKYTISVHLGDKSSNEHIQTLENIVSFTISLDSINSEYGWQKNSAIYFEDYIWKTNNSIYEINY